MTATNQPGALPLGTTFASELARLEATAEGREALASAQLSEQMLTLMRSDDMSRGLAVSILQSRVVEKCQKAGIDVERVLVTMAKAVAHPKPAQGEWVDVLPDLATREDVAAAMIPYAGAMGVVKLSEIFFPGVPGEIRHFINGQRKPAFEALVALVGFLTRDELLGRPIREWTEDRAAYFLAKCRVFDRWDPFDQDADPAPGIRDYDSFLVWFKSRVPATHAQYVADFTDLDSALLDKWRRGANKPSSEMLAKLFSAVREHHPEWLGSGAVGSPASAQAATAVAPAAAKSQRARETASQTIEPPAPEPQAATAHANPPAREWRDESALATAAQEVAELLELLAPKLRLLAQSAAQPDPPARERRDEPVPGFTPISDPEPAPEPPTTPVPQESDDDAIVSGRQPVGEQSGRIRFLLTSDTFVPFTGSFTKGEMADMRTLLRELARRLALVNAKTGDAPAKDAIVNALATDLVALAAQLRGLDFREVALLIGDADMLVKEN